MKVTINGLNNVLIKLDNYSKDLPIKTDELCRKCAEYGKQEAEKLYSQSVKDGEDDGSFDIEKRDKGYAFNALGREPIFVEFGAGVHFNGTGSYPKPIPNGIKGIGQYGKGRGKQDKWAYVDSYGTKHWTYGTRCQKPMYNASRRVVMNIEKIAKEVFK